MPLTQDEIQSLRQMSMEDRKFHFLKRIALTLEDIATELKVMNERGAEGRPGEGRHPFAD